VTDNGIGFNTAESDRIFDPFFRLHPRGSFSGSGLGLSIVKRIVEGHHGIVTSESETGKGSVFHIYFPKENR
jgi:signal transduction histidine kinase